MDLTDILPNLASKKLGAKILFSTDDFFAAAERILLDDEPVWRTDVYTPFGKWMDGWETRRKRTPGNDWCLIKLAHPGTIRTIEINTRFFIGNFSSKVSIQGRLYATSPAIDMPEEIKTLEKLREKSVADMPENGRMGTCASLEEESLASVLESDNWQTIVPLSSVGIGNQETYKTVFEIPIAQQALVSHLRFNLGPDGGIARIRVYGQVKPNLTTSLLQSDFGNIDLISIENGGLALACTNHQYGHPRNLTVPGRGDCMGDGWVSARQVNRPPFYQKDTDENAILPGSDWALFQLGVLGSRVNQVEIDTHFYIGNYPDSCMIEACYFDKEKEQSLEKIIQKLTNVDEKSNIEWKVLLPKTKLTADTRHFFSIEDNILNKISHVKLTIFPDGGIMRFRLMGRPFFINI